MTARAQPGWRVGRIAGIELRVHPTFLILLVLAAVGLFGPPLDGIAWLSILFASVVFHELSHSLTAKAFGLRVRDIVLLPIGGASEIEGLGDDPRRELWVALAGPASSFVLAGSVAAVVAIAGGDLSPELADGPLVVRAVWANVMLGTFNLLPALPMDGGRVLRALLAGRLGAVAATRRAAAVGRHLAVVMAIVGLLLMPWLLLIAVVVYFTARAEEIGVVAHERFAGVLVRDVMTPVHDPDLRLGSITVQDDALVEAVLADLAATRDGIATVVDSSGRSTGVLVSQQLAELIDRD